MSNQLPSMEDRHDRPSYQKNRGLVLLWHSRVYIEYGGPYLRVPAVNLQNVVDRGERDLLNLGARVHRRLVEHGGDDASIDGSQLRLVPRSIHQRGRDLRCVLDCDIWHGNIHKNSCTLWLMNRLFQKVIPLFTFMFMCGRGICRLPLCSTRFLHVGDCSQDFHSMCNSSGICLLVLQPPG